MFACTVPPAEDVLCDWAHPDCRAVRERAPYLPSGATRSCVHISGRAVTHSRGERVLSWGQHLCSPAKKARQALRGQAAVQHSVLCVASIQAEKEKLKDEQEGCGGESNECHVLFPQQDAEADAYKGGMKWRLWTRNMREKKISTNPTGFSIFYCKVHF